MKIAVIFPGVGYHPDKPLLYYSKKIAAAYGYEILEAEYGILPEGVKGSHEKMMEAFRNGRDNTVKQLDAAEIWKYDEALFISKSIGTLIAAACGEKYQMKEKNIYFTPVNESFLYIKKKRSGIVFHGTNDSWARTRLVKQECQALELPLYLTENGNHSLETGNVIRDLKNLTVIMEQVEKYISRKK